jgi:peptide methionine sulfoxide reductase msrA/msrB
MKVLTVACCLGLALLLFSLLFLPLPGRSQAEWAALQATPSSVTPVSMPGTVQLESIVLGAGCFWGVEKRYQALPGVVDAVSGYADGRGIKPSYTVITQPRYRQDPNNFAEVVQVTFNPQIISLERILQFYFEQHDPTQLNRQGNDIGTQYRSTILFNDAKQQKTATKVLAEYQQLLAQAGGYGAIVTQVKALETFYPAEDYHQDYLAKNPQGYCPDHSTGVRFQSLPVAEQPNNGDLMQGKQILVIDAADYCPYCEQFKQQVANDYRGSIPLTFRLASQLQGLQLTTPTWATPTIVFLQDGKEVFGRQGAMSAEDFYRALGHFKLGESEAFNVAFDEGTDSRFCQQYEIFKDTPDGVFVDKLSGAILFDTRDRFDSGTGWLSFTKPVDGAVLEKPDHRYGMQRTEIRAAKSGIHLGHVFDDGPAGQRRFCINATVLEFVPRAAVGGK